MPQDPPASLARPVRAILLVQLAACVVLGYTLNVWLDEAVTLDTTRDGIARAFLRSVHFELHPPGHFVLLSVWRMLDDSLGFARLLSALSVTGALAILARVWQRLGTGVAPTLPVLALALHPFTVYAAAEARPYGLSLLLAAGFWWAMIEGFVDDRGRRGARVTAAVLAWALLMTQYYAGFVLAAAALPFALERRWRALARYVGWMLVVGLAFAPMALIVLDQLGGHQHAGDGRGGLLGVARFAWGRTAMLLLPTLYVPDEEAPRRLRDLLILGAGAWALLRVRRGGWPGANRALAATAITAAAALPGFMAAGWLTRAWEMVQTRHMVAWFPLLMLSAFALAARLGGRRAVAMASLAVGLFSTATLLATYHPYAKRGDWARVAAHLEDAGSADEPVLVFHVPSVLALDWHYDGPAELLSVPRPLPTDRWHLPAFRIESVGELERLDRERLGAPGRLWIVTDGTDRYMGVDFNREALERWIARDFRVIEDRAFHISELRLLERRGRAHSRAPLREPSRPAPRHP